MWLRRAPLPALTERPVVPRSSSQSEPLRSFMHWLSYSRRGASHESGATWPAGHLALSVRTTCTAGLETGPDPCYSLHPRKTAPRTGVTLASTALSLLAVIVLVALNGFFVAAEFALVSVRKSRVDAMVLRGSAAAKMVQRAIGHLDVYIAATQLGITMASLWLGFVAEPSIARLIDPLLQLLPFLHGSGALVNSHSVALAIAFAIATTLHIVFGELAPKSLALQRPDVTALWVTAPLNLFLQLFRPFIVGLNAIGNGVVRLIGLQPAGEHGSIHSVEELEMLVHSTRVAGLLEEQQERMVSGVFEFGARPVSRAMTPRTEVDAASVTMGLAELAERVDNARHSRLPIYDGDLDHILGVVHAKDIIHHLPRSPAETTHFELRSALRPYPLFPRVYRWTKSWPSCAVSEHTWRSWWMNSGARPASSPLKTC